MGIFGSLRPALCCKGRRNSVSCGQPLHKCDKCGAVGCLKSACSNHTFTDGQCDKCGSHKNSVVHQ